MNPMKNPLQNFDLLWKAVLGWAVLKFIGAHTEETNWDITLWHKIDYGKIMIIFKSAIV